MYASVTDESNFAIHPEYDWQSEHRFFNILAVIVEYRLPSGFPHFSDIPVGIAILSGVVCIPAGSAEGQLVCALHIYIQR